ncbi:exo-beta-1,3-glucanase (GH17 family)/cellulose synthase/poly-beta-1,6-N-acetylglucosamine synthase-like glycosyltransferase [Povalibacter uvarum]|uniref:Beta-monoglucosyldiacylglycerol synthase n=1 Tax=Povalibacter uvarum TaxID=732238 RepID=A0A841HN09_9GAMM|nr:glycosyltransferase [Povalibacter uvarum]MBB6094517.1 exo-beta-1,3-glucanase (GH17 family)/cellulose synthase/poly-beta-1,6-N-acetylglucosamine synthase-like glycosyltransferase [Povalibacter uvarum]
MKFSSYLVAIVFAAITFGLWAWLNRPVDEPHWPQRVQGMAFSPFQANQNPVDRVLPSTEQIDADLALLARASVNAVRTYSSLDTLAEVPELAERHQIKVAVGAWLDRNRATNEKEIAAAIELARDHANVIRLVIGNESVLRGDLSVNELTAALDRVRDAVEQPVSTAEPWHVWITHPKLAEHVDFIGVHLLPYWEGIPVEEAVDYMASRIELLEKTFPGKRVVICEVGWPSEGRTREGAVASLSNEALFLRRFLARARDEGYVYYIMEAFDQPWKARYEGAVGAYWGVYNVERQPKFEFIKPIVRIPQWQMLAGISVVVAAILLALVYTNSSGLGTRGSSFLAIVIYAAATIAVLVIYQYSQQYLTLVSVIVGAFLILGMLGVIAIVVAEAVEWAEARWARRRRSLNAPLPALSQWPKVSIHVPAYNEPAAMLTATLDALARLDYPDYEVLVIDNNTADESVWRPVEAHCRRLGERFRFFHVKPLAGFKAGALNFALERTDPAATIVAVIDSDYQVAPRWLRDLVPAFSNDKVAIVQAPQDYRDHEVSFFKAMCYAEYRGFFHIGMITRNERNAIIQHGTMMLVQRDALVRTGGWAQWSITEDAELGLRLFEHGYEAYYLPRSYGRGLMPDTFGDYKKQRFRWAYGAMQILRRHSGALFARRTQLTTGQRYHFVAGWLPWLADGLNLIFNIAAIGWSIAMVYAPHRIDPPLVMFSILPLALFTFKLVKLAHLYVSRVGANIRQTIAAALAGLALSHTIGLAMLKGMVTRDEPFFRTPKEARPHVLTRAFAGAVQEALFLILLLAAVYFLTHQVVLPNGTSLGVPAELRGPDVAVWIAVLMIQAVPYGAALLVSLISETALPAKWLGRSKAHRARDEVMQR